jgi:Thermolysin metallopeptidase, alpha-helical domain/Thermolysin metallopeptidase, catalytic domain
MVRTQRRYQRRLAVTATLIIGTCLATPGYGAATADPPGLGFFNGPVTIGTTPVAGGFEMSDPARSHLSCGSTVQTVDPPVLGPRFRQAVNTWGNGQPADHTTACVDAMYAAGAEWDMLRAWLDRNGIDGQGQAAGIGVGLRDANAFFTVDEHGPRVILGRVGGSTPDPEDPEPANARRDPEHRQFSSMDIVAHEFGHMIFETTPGGSGDTIENGALNEGTGDIFAQLTIAFANNPLVPLTYTMGAQLESAFGRLIRIMYQPSLLGDPDCYSPEIFTEGHDVHDSAGPLNHWFYLLAEGSHSAGRPASSTCDRSTLTGIGIQLAGKIFYNGLLRKTATWTFRDARWATLTATKQLFPRSCTEFNKVKAAWNAVSVPARADEPTCGLPVTGNGVTAPAAGGIGLITVGTLLVLAAMLRRRDARLSESPS